MERSQSRLIAAAGLGAAVIFLLLMLYYGVAAAGHPHVKHMVLFLFLAIVALLVSWFSYPKAAA
jgi:hypothetical protein